MNKMGNIVLRSFVFISTLAIAYERQEQDDVVITAHMFNDNQDEIVTRGIKARDFAWRNLFPIQIVLENKSQSKLILDPSISLELANTFDVASFMCEYNSEYAMRVGFSCVGFLYSLIPLIGTPVLLSGSHIDFAVQGTIASTGLGLIGLLMAFGIKQGNLAGKVRDQIKADLEASYNPIIINPGQVIKRIFYFVPPQEDTVTFYVTDETNGKLLTFNFETE